MQLDKTEKIRRKGKVNQQKHFHCKCGKSYFSYAAAYTHVSNKHDRSKQFIEGIVKPEVQQLKRGRPKQKKQQLMTLETNILTIAESATLKICQQLKNNSTRIILEGDQERDQHQFGQIFNQIVRKLHFNYVQKQPITSFIRMMIKDFRSEIAAKVKFAIIFFNETNYSHQNMLQQIKIMNLWKGHQQVTSILYLAWQQWRKLTEAYPSQEFFQVDFDL